MIAIRADLDHMNGTSCNNGAIWEALEVQCYVDVQKETFRGVKKINIVADPSSYQGMNTMVAILYAWQRSVAAIGPTVITTASKQLQVCDWVGVPNEVMEKVRARKNKKMERLASLHEWRSVSCILHQYTNLSMDSFMIPPGTAIRSQLPTEQRNKVADGDIDMYFFA